MRNESETRSRPCINTTFGEKQCAFLDFVLSHYVAEGYEELDQEKLGPLLQLRYSALSDAVLDLGPSPRIREMFASFQQYLY